MAEGPGSSKFGCGADTTPPVLRPRLAPAPLQPPLESQYVGDALRGLPLQPREGGGRQPPPEWGSTVHPLAQVAAMPPRGATIVDQVEEAPLNADPSLLLLRLAWSLSGLSCMRRL